MVYDPTLFNTQPYYDDYDDTKKYLRLLFKPGYALQARELTQLQTVLQDQIARFGDHVFVNGSKVVGGEISTQDVGFIRINPGPTDQDDASVDVSSFVGLDLVSVHADDPRRARVLHGMSGGTSGVDPSHILFVQYLNGGSGGAVSFEADQPVKGVSGANTFSARVAQSGNASVTGSAKLVTVDNGVYFYDGYFVKTDKASVVPYGITSSIRDFASPTSRVGFLADRQIVTTDEDVTLRDPASGAYNYNAPGADRFKIDLNLHFINFTNSATAGASGYSDANFVELLRFVDGNVVLRKENSIYSELEKTLARRTYDESGSYTVKPFEIDLRESLDSIGGVFSAANGGTSGKLAAEILPGKAYVFGYEFETLAPRYSLIDKGRSAGSDSNKPMNTVKFGQYAKVRSEGVGSLTGGIDFVNNFPQILLSSAGGHTGTARVRTIIPNNDTVGLTAYEQSYNLYLFDIALGGITAFGHITEFGGTALSSIGITASFVPATGGTGHSNGVTGTLLFNPDAGAALFPAPIGSAVKSVTSLTYRCQKGFTFEQTSVDNVVYLSSGNSNLTFAGVLATLDEGDKKTHYLLISNGSTGAYGSTGERVNTNQIKFGRANNNQTLQIGHAVSTIRQLPVGKYSLIATMDVSNPDATTSLFRKKTFTAGSTSGYIRTAGQNSGLSGSTGSYYLALGHVDVYDVKSVVDNSGVVATRLGIAGSDIKGAFLFDNGQRDNYYDFAKLYLNPSHGTGGGVITGDIDLTITYDRFEHDSGVGPFTVNSYTHTSSNFNYDNIPIYTSPTTGKSYSLRNCIDFRGTAQSNGTIAPNGLVPKTGQDFRISHEYYLSRIDKVILTKEREFDVIRGIPSLNPQTPPDRDDAMTLYVITVPAYTFNPSDAAIKYVENKRYTMRDIGLIEKRVENLEYYTSLSLLEQQTEARSITDADGVDIFKNGILVDSFRGHGVGDVLNRDYKCSIDPENGHLRPAFTSNSVKLDQVSNISGITQQPAGTLLLNYAVYSQFVWQPLASGTIQVNAFGVPSFMGYVDFTDQFDGWYDTTKEPKVKINTQGENDRWKVNNPSNGFGFGTHWNDWESLWSGRTVMQSDLYGNRGRELLNEFATAATAGTVEPRINLAESSAIRSTETLRNQESRVGIRVRKLPERLEKVVNGKLVDVSVVPFIKSKTTTLSAYGLKPNTRVYPFFDGTDVAQYCGPTGGASGDAIYSDSQGRVIDAFFSIPSAAFRTGEKIFRLTDNALNTVSATTTAADGIYFALGTVQQRDGSNASTRPFVSRRQVPNDEAVVKDAFDRAQYISTHANNTWIDPLAQTFSVDADYYANGVFAHSIDLFFAERDENLPVTLELRPTVSGYPHLSQSLPFSTVTLIPNSSEVVSSPNEDNFTRFTFTSPVYLAPGDYSICVKSSSDKYRLYYAEVGGVQLDSGTLISQQPYNGALFVPQNTGIATANTNKSLKFKVNVCEFSSSGSVRLGLSSTDFTAGTVDVLKINSGELQPRTTSLGYDFDLGSLSSVPVIANENIYLESSQNLSAPAGFVVDANFSTSDSFVSPVIDLERFDLISVSNTVNNSTNTTTNGELNANGHGTDSTLYGTGTANPTLTPGCAAKYITRRVTLADGFESTNFKVILGVNKPAEASIQVFIKALTDEDATQFEDVGYTQLTEDTTVLDASNDYDFTDVTYSLSSNFVKPVKTFAVKVCLYSSSSTKVPSIRDFRTIALAG